MNFKNHFELYKALIEGKTIIHDNSGTMVKTSNGLVLASCDRWKSWGYSSWSFNNPEQWKIYEEPETWFRVTSLYCKNERPFTHGTLYRSKEDFLNETGSNEKDYHWINLEEFKRG